MRRARRLVAKLLVAAFVCACAATLTTAAASAQRVGGLCGTQPCASAQDDSFRDKLESLTDSAKDIVPAFIASVQEPLGPYFDGLAQVLAYGTALVFVLRLIRQSGDTDEMYWGLARMLCMFVLLGYVTYRPADASSPDLVTTTARAANSLAYGGAERPSKIGGLVRQRQLDFSNGYSDFVENSFYYTVDGENRLIAYSDDSPNGAQVFAVGNSGGEALQKFAAALSDGRGWSMDWLFRFLNAGRGVLEFGDLFILVLQGFLLAAVKLAAPFMVAISIDREFAGRIGKNFAWGAVVVLVIMPIISQMVRWFAFSAGAIPFGRVTSPYFVFDPTTGNVVVNGNPEYMIVVCGVVMMICGLCMFASPFISYKLAQGGVFEAITSTAAGWMGAMIGTGVSMWSAATGSAISRQAAEMTANASAGAEGATATGAYRAELASASAKHSADAVRSRAEAVSATQSAGLEAWAAGSRADISAATQTTGFLTQLGETQINNAAKTRAEAFGASVGLDKAAYESYGIFGSMVQEGRDGYKHATGSGQPDDYNDYLYGNDWSGAGDGQTGGTEFTPRLLGQGEAAPGWAAVVPHGGTFNSPRDGGARAHRAVDQSAPAGTPIGVAAEGTVTQNGWSEKAGWYVEVDHGGGWKTSYAHLQQQSTAAVGTQIGQGQMIGAVGNTGSGSHGNHLHFVTRYNGQRVDPEKTNLRPFLGSSSGNPGGMSVTIPSGNEAIRNAPFPVQDKVIPFEKARIEAGAGDAAAAWGARVKVARAQAEAGDLHAVASHEAGVKQQIAWTAHNARVNASGIEMLGAGRSAQLRFDSTRAAIQMRHEAALRAAQMQALSTIITSFGSTIANQMQGAAQQYNRF